MKLIKKSLFSAALIATSMAFLAGCGGNNDQPKDDPKKDDPVVEKLNANVTLTPVEGEFETHTAVQLEYFSGTDVRTLPSAANGRNENSKPNSLELSFNIESSETVNSADLYLYENDDKVEPIVYNVKTDEGFLNKLTIKNLKVGTDYKWKIKLVGEGNKEFTSEESTFKTANTGTRFIDIDGVSNVRDIGGKVTESGKTVKQGLIYRGAEFNKQNYGKSSSEKIDEDSIERAKEKPYGKKITAEGENTVLNELKIKTEIDVRGYEHYEYIDTTSQYYLNPSPTEIGGLVDGRGILLDLKYVLNPIDTNHDKIYKTEGGKAAVKRFFSVLADETNYPVYFHCAQGKDRTGFIGYVLDGFLGMTKDDMCRDFIISNFSSVGSVSLDYFLNKTTPSGEGSRYDYGAYFDGYEVKDMAKLTGTTMQERMTEYLLSCGLTQTQLDNILKINLK